MFVVPSAPEYWDKTPTFEKKKKLLELLIVQQLIN